VAAARKKPLLDRVDPALVANVERTLRAAGALPLTKLPRAGLTKEAALELERQLLARGLERAPRVLRVPVDEQILALVQGGGRLPLKDLSKRVKGASKAELAAAVGRLVRAGRARVVVRTQVEVLVGGAERVLDRDALDRLGDLYAHLGKVLKKVKAKGPPRSILADDVAALLGPFGATRPAETPKEPARALVVEAVARLEDPVLKLVRVPDVVRSLAGRFGVAEVHRALVEAADAGAIELRPEAGGEFLDAEDARLCPPGPRGSVFSYARRLPS
jgi:DNA-binding Lrp family transcriptional regulator